LVQSQGRNSLTTHTRRRSRAEASRRQGRRWQSAFADFIDSKVGGAYTLRLDLNKQVVGNDGQADAVTIRQTGDPVQVFVNGVLYQQDPEDRMIGVHVIGSSDTTTVTVEASVTRLRVTAQNTQPVDDLRSQPPARLFAMGADAGGGPQVIVYNADGSLRFSFLAYDPAFLGGVRVATADVNGDGVDDVVTGAGPGGGPHVRAFSSLKGDERLSFFAFEPTDTNGVFVG
jgi:hypothetical protein